MQYLKDAKKVERDENYRHLVGDLRRRVYQRLGDVLEQKTKPTRQEIKALLYSELQEGGVTDELAWYAEGFCRGLLEDGSGYYRGNLPPQFHNKANRHNQLGYSAGSYIRHLRNKEGKVTRVR